MNRTRKILVLGLVVAALPLAAFAGGFGGGHFGGHPRAASAEEAREHAGKMTDRALDRVDATDAQRTAIDGVLDRNVPKLYALHEEGADLREEGRALLVADTIDANAVEAVRTDAMALAEEGSHLVANTIVEVGNILSAEQRRELASVMERMRHGGGRHGGPDDQDGPRRGER